MNTFIEVKKKKELEYSKWVEHLSKTKDRSNYAIQRMDLLIISICGAGIYIIFETIRELKGHLSDFENEKMLLFSGILFLLGITVNFISQATGYQANKYETEYTYLKLKELEKKDYNKDKMKAFDKLSKNYSKYTQWSNILSITFMFIGLFLLAKFNYHLV